jgi:hypothetical protein
MLLDAFASHAPPELLKLPPDQIYQKVQIASLVETEAKVDSDRALIAGVYVNRLNPKLWPTGLLDADPTLNYANDSVWLEFAFHRELGELHVLEPDHDHRRAEPGRLPGSPGRVQHVPPRRPAAHSRSARPAGRRWRRQ